MSAVIPRLLLSVCLAASLLPAAPADAPIFRDANGLLCLEAEHAVAVVDWEKTAFYTGRGLRAQAAGGSADYRLEIRQPGTYRLFLLGARSAGATNNRVGVSLAREGAEFVPAAQLGFRDHNAIAWTDLDATGTAGASLTIPAPGFWRLRLSAASGRGFFLDKLVLTAGGFTPTGTGPAETLAHDAITAAAGFDPQVVLPPAWAFGVLYGGYTDQAQTLEAIARLRTGNFPIDAYWIDSWFWDFVKQGKGPGGYLRFEEDRAVFPDIAAMWAEFSRQGIKAGVWIWDCILREGNEAVFDDFNARGFFRDVYIERGGWHNQTKMTIGGNIDFDSPAAVAHWRGKLAPFFAAGLDFLKIDRSSDLNFTQAAFEATQQLGRETRGRGFILAHLHSTHDPRFKLYPTKWSGDAKIAWSQPDYPDNRIYAMGGLRENIGIVADPKRSTYEVPFLAHDAGGYDRFGDGTPSEELYTRWLQFSALNTVTTLFSYAASPTRNHPYAYPEATQAMVRKYLHLRMRLFPYLYTAALDTRLTGQKPVQGDGVHEYQYLLGPHLLVAPVYTPGAATREVHLPAGRWYDWDTDRAFDGGRTLVVEAPLEKLPLFVRAGAIIPLRDYAPSIGAGTNARLTLELWPGPGATEYILREDDGTSNDYLGGGFASTKIRLVPQAGRTTLEIAAVEGGYTGMAPAREWVVRLHHQPAPRAIRLNGQPVEYSHDPATGILVVKISGEKSVARRLTVE